MKNKKNFGQHGYGGLEWILAGFVVAVVLYFFVYPTTFPKSRYTDNESSNFCRPYINDDGSFKTDAPEITAPAYDASSVRRGQPFPSLIPNQMVTYRLIKSTVPIKDTSLLRDYHKELLHNSSPNEIHCETFVFNGAHHAHFCQWIHETIKVSPNISKAYQYAVLYPAPYSDGNTTDRFIGASDPYDSEVESQTVVRYGTYHLLFLIQLDKDNNPIRLGQLDQSGMYAADVYQQTQEGNHSQPLTQLPDNLLTCIDGASSKTEMTFGEAIENSPDKKQEQLGWFVPRQNNFDDNWYSPACKPAINLYPTKDTLVNVKVAIPNGFLTYTDPLYSKDSGWNVLAHPNGDLNYLSNNLASSKGIINYPSGVFPYLYYEGKINDDAIQKPQQGFIKPYDHLSAFFDELLPKLGLNSKETEEFKAYWLKALPKSNYYFIGIVPQDQLDTNEPLIISPKQDTMIRVRLYLQQLDQPETVQEPTITSPVRNGFTVVDWGAYVKNDQQHPFTCIQ